MFELIGRGERIRTSGPCLPKTVLYQAELLPDRVSGTKAARETGGGSIRRGRGERKRLSGRLTSTGRTMRRRT